MGMRAGQLRNPWAQRCEDNIIQMKREAVARAFMQKRLDSMTAYLDTSPPKSIHMKHLELRLKKIQMQDDRKIAIAKDNRKLMEKMTGILEGKDKKPIWEPPTGHLRPRHERMERERVQRINQDNKAMLHRLRTQEGSINAAKLEEEYRHWLETRKNCSKAYVRARRAQMLSRKMREEEAAHVHRQHQKEGADGKYANQSMGTESQSSMVLGRPGEASHPGSIRVTSLASNTNRTSTSHPPPHFRTARQLRQGLAQASQQSHNQPDPALFYNRGSMTTVSSLSSGATESERQRHVQQQQQQVSAMMSSSESGTQAPGYLTATTMSEQSVGPLTSGCNTQPVLTRETREHSETSTGAGADQSLKDPSSALDDYSDDRSLLSQEGETSSGAEKGEVGKPRSARAKGSHEEDGVESQEGSHEPRQRGMSQANMTMWPEDHLRMGFEESVNL